jgi:hypothetical protein
MSRILNDSNSGEEDDGINEASSVFVYSGQTDIPKHVMRIKISSQVKEIICMALIGTCGFCTSSSSGNDLQICIFRMHTIG